MPIKNKTRFWTNTRLKKAHVAWTPLSRIKSMYKAIKIDPIKKPPKNLTIPAEVTSIPYCLIKDFVLTTDLKA